MGKENDKIIRRYNQQHDRIARDHGIYTGRNWTFRYILNNEDLIDSYLDGMADLGYPLRKEVKRDRYVVNKEALKKAIEKSVNKEMSNFEKQFDYYIQKEVLPYLLNKTEDMMSPLTGVTSSSHIKEPKGWFERFGEQLGKALINSIFNILDETLHN